MKIGFSSGFGFDIGNISAQHIDNDSQNSVVICVETPNLFLINLLPSINKIIITYKIIVVIYVATKTEPISQLTAHH